VFNFSNKGSLSLYLPESRNFLISKQKNQLRHRLLHRGRENIIDFLEKLPKTKHDLGSFIVDVPLATVSILFYFKRMSGQYLFSLRTTHNIDKMLSSLIVFFYDF